MNACLPVSIIISSYNYGRFVGEAIESALAQNYARVEVIVVDDGSTDNSRVVIGRYADRVRMVCKENGGQASAFNAGFAASEGAVVIFLDSDDVLLPGAVAQAMPRFGPGVSKVHWPLWEVSEDGSRSGEVTPRDALSEGDLRPGLQRAGADGYTWPPTSGNAWARHFLEKIMPMPESEYRTCPDYYLSTLAPLFGTVGRLAKPQGCWRNHGKNQSWAQPIGERLQTMLQRFEHSIGFLAQHCQRLGLELDVERCRANSWWQWLAQTYEAVQEIERAVPAGAKLILVDEDAWDPREVWFTNRRVVPFSENDGIYGGPPEDEATAVRELERLRQAGASFIAFAWPAFWWLDYYAALKCNLQMCCRQVLRSERVIVYDLRA